MKKSIALLVTAAACNGSFVDLGGVHPDAAAASDGDTPATGGNTVDSSSSCGYNGPRASGDGYLPDVPLSCSDAVGTPESFATVSQVEAALVGTWSTCAADPSAQANEFVKTLDPNASGIEFATDGHFGILAAAGSAANPELVPASGRAADAGTFDVVDASASLGPGTYRLRLSASDGGVYTTQVVVFGSTPRLRFFSPTADDYLPAISKKYQANVCGVPLGATETPSAGTDALARMQGRWARCSDPHAVDDASFRTRYTPFPGQGLEVANGTWYLLTTDASGQLVRATAAESHGTVEVAGSAPASLTFSNGNVAFAIRPILGECDTLAFAAVGTESDVYVHLP